MRPSKPVQVLFLFAFSLLAAVPAAVASTQARTNALVRALSSSRQFVVYCPEQLLPHVIGVFAEQVRSGWRAQLNAEDAWRDPIVATRFSLHPLSVHRIHSSSTILKS